MKEVAKVNQVHKGQAGPLGQLVSGVQQDYQEWQVHLDHRDFEALRYILFCTVFKNYV